MLFALATKPINDHLRSFEDKLLSRLPERIRPPILYRYVFREILGPSLMALFIFTGILFLARILKLVDLVVNKSVPMTDILLLFSYVVPAFLEIAVPMALLLGVILALGRLSADSEIIVLRASGLSVRQLAAPVLFFATLCFILCLNLSLFLRPWANHKLGQGMFDIAKTKASAGLTQGIFNDIGPLTLYSEKVESESGRLVNVLLADRRDPEVNRLFLAKYGQIVSDEERRSLSLQLYDGSIQEGSGMNFNITYFQINSISLPQSELMLEDDAEREGKRSNEIAIGELFASINRLQSLPKPLTAADSLKLARYQVELQRRIAIPCSCFCIALAAIALGIQPARGGHGWGATANIVLGIFLILFYYLLLAFGTAMGSASVLPAWIAVWIPNVLYLSLGYYWFRQMGSERWIAVSQAVGDFFQWCGKGFRFLSPENNPPTSGPA